MEGKNLNFFEEKQKAPKGSDKTRKPGRGTKEESYHQSTMTNSSLKKLSTVPSRNDYIINLSLLS